MLGLDPLRRRLRAMAGAGSRGTVTPAAVGRAVASAALRLPGTACLARALAAEALLLRHGLPARLRVGVAKGGGGLDAHAWTASGGEVVAGSGDLSRYAAFDLDPS